MKQNRIIIVLEHMNLSGAERQAVLLARGLKAQYDMDVEIWGFGGPGDVSRICDEYGIRWKIVKVRFFAKWYRLLLDVIKLVVFLRKAHPRVLMPFTVIPNIVCGLIWRWTGANICIWNQRDEGRGLEERKTELLAIKNTSMFVSNSMHAADMLMAKYGISKNRIRVIRNGIDIVTVETERTCAREKLTGDRNGLVACMLGKIQRVYKDHDTLLKAWRLVVDCVRKKMNVSTILMLAGVDYGHKNKLQTIMSKIGLSDADVKFLGAVDDIHELLKTVDVGVFSSQLEGCPNGVLECMAAGLPVVATDIPGVREAVGPSGYEYLAPVGDAETMADLILKFMNDPELRRKAGEANRERVRAEFSVERMSKEYIDLMREHGGLKI